MIIIAGMRKFGARMRFGMKLFSLSPRRRHDGDEMIVNAAQL
jgi:hypothetical protein